MTTLANANAATKKEISDIVLANASYATLIKVDGATQIDNVGATPVLLNSWDFQGPTSSDMITNIGGTITVPEAGRYDFNFQISFSGTGSSEWDFVIMRHLDGTPSASFWKATHKLGTGGEVGSCSLCGVLPLDADEEVGIYYNSDGANDDIIIKHSQFIVRRIGT